MEKINKSIKALIILTAIGMIFGVIYLVIEGGKVNNLENDKKIEIEEEKEKNNEEIKKKEKTEKERLEKIEKENEKKDKDKLQESKGRNLIESGKEYAVSAEKVNKMMVGEKDGQKEVFLTFDDGPSENTKKVLDILNKYNVHGTFFVLGSNLNGSNQNILKRTYNEGNAIGNHTYSHRYEVLYPNNKVNIKAFMSEVKKTNTRLSEILGQDFKTSVIRMPGGYVSRKYHKDPNLKELNKTFEKEKIVSIDWNIDSADSSGIGVPAEKIVQTTIKGIGNLEDVVVLMHDTGSKGTTIQALPKIIEHFQKEGYIFKVISN